MGSTWQPRASYMGEELSNRHNNDSSEEDETDAWPLAGMGALMKTRATDDEQGAMEVVKRTLPSFADRMGDIYSRTFANRDDDYGAVTERATIMLGAGLDRNGFNVHADLVAQHTKAEEQKRIEAAVRAKAQSFSTVSDVMERLRLATAGDDKWLQHQDLEYDSPQVSPSGPAVAPPLVPRVQLPRLLGVSQLTPSTSLHCPGPPPPRLGRTISVAAAEAAAAYSSGASTPTAPAGAPPWYSRGVSSALSDMDDEPALDEQDLFDTSPATAPMPPPVPRLSLGAPLAAPGTPTAAVSARGLPSAATQQHEAAPHAATARAYQPSAPRGLNSLQTFTSDMDFKMRVSIPDVGSAPAGPSSQPSPRRREPRSSAPLAPAFTSTKSAPPSPMQTAAIAGGGEAARSALAAMTNRGKQPPPKHLALSAPYGSTSSNNRHAADPSHGGWNPSSAAAALAAAASNSPALNDEASYTNSAPPAHHAHAAHPAAVTPHAAATSSAAATAAHTAAPKSMRRMVLRRHTMAASPPRTSADGDATSSAESSSASSPLSNQGSFHRTPSADVLCEDRSWRDKAHRASDAWLPPQAGDPPQDDGGDADADAAAEEDAPTSTYQWAAEEPVPAAAAAAPMPSMPQAPPSPSLVRQHRRVSQTSGGGQSLHSGVLPTAEEPAPQQQGVHPNHTGQSHAQDMRSAIQHATATAAKKAATNYAKGVLRHQGHLVSEENGLSDSLRLPSLGGRGSNSGSSSGTPARAPPSPGIGAGRRSTAAGPPPSTAPHKARSSASAPAPPSPRGQPSGRNPDDGSASLSDLLCQASPTSNKINNWRSGNYAATLSVSFDPSGQTVDWPHSTPPGFGVGGIPSAENSRSELPAGCEGLQPPKRFSDPSDHALSAAAGGFMSGQRGSLAGRANASVPNSPILRAGRSSAIAQSPRGPIGASAALRLPHVRG